MSVAQVLLVLHLTVAQMLQLTAALRRSNSRHGTCFMV